MLSLFVCQSWCSISTLQEERSFLNWMRSTNNYFVADEYNLRLGIYLANSRFVKETNAKNLGFRVSMNKFACLTPAESKTIRGLKPHPVSSNKYVVPYQKSPNFVAPASIDWRKKNVVNPIKDQGYCGSCWAFSTVGAQESAWAIYHGQLYDLAESFLVDCLKDCDGCDGGYPYDACYEIINSYGGKFMLTKDYPYVPKRQTCQFKKESAVTHLISYTQIELGDEDQLLNECAEKGPVSVCIDTAPESFQLYTGGIWYDDGCTIWGLDHAVIAVGYGAENSEKYWIVRNSWGEDWGEQGYIRMKRGIDLCGIAIQAIVPNNA